MVYNSSQGFGYEIRPTTEGSGASAPGHSVNNAPFMPTGRMEWEAQRLRDAASDYWGSQQNWNQDYMQGITRKYADQSAQLGMQNQQQQLAKLQQDMALKQQLMGLLSGMFSSSSSTSPPGTVNYGDIQTLLNQAQAQRNATFAPGANYGLNRLADLSSFNGQSMGALRDLGRQDIGNSYTSSLRDLRSLTSDRSMPAETAAAMRADLLRQRIRSGKDLTQGLLSNEANRQGGISGSLASGIYNEQVNRLGSPELGAQLNLDAQKTNALAQQQRIQQLLSLFGGV